MASFDDRGDCADLDAFWPPPPPEFANPDRGDCADLDTFCPPPPLAFAAPQQQQQQQTQDSQHRRPPPIPVRHSPIASTTPFSSIGGYSTSPLTPVAVSLCASAAAVPPPAPTGAMADRRFLEEYLSDMSRNEAMEALNAVQMDGAYIVRRGRESPYCISFLHAGCTKHVQIRSNFSGQFFLGDTKIETLFDTMSQLMDYLTKNVIQCVNGAVFRLLINAKPRTQRSQLPGSEQRRHSSATGIGYTPAAIQNPKQRSYSINQPCTATVAPPSPMPIDLSLIRPLSQQPYFANFRRDEAETFLLQRRTEGQFLVRPSKTSSYCLSVFHKNRVVHLKIIRMECFFVLEQLMNDGEKYNSIPDLIDSLTINRRSLTMMNGDSIVLKTD